MGLPGGQKSFKIGLVVLIQYRLWQPATQPPTQPRCRSYYRAYCVAQVKILLGDHLGTEPNLVLFPWKMDWLIKNQKY